MSSQSDYPAPDATVYRGDSSPVAISSLWRTQPLVLSFLRHYGCQFCREFVTMLRAAYPEFVARGVAVAAVGQGSAPQAAHFASVYRLPFPMLADPARSAYQAFGLIEGTLDQTINGTVILKMMGKAAQGTLPGVGDHLRALRGSDGSSLRQLGGSFVIGVDGRVRYAHIDSPIHRHPDISDLLAAAAP
jgi:peroxiredoxin